MVRRVARLQSLEFGYEILPVAVEVEVGPWIGMGCTAEGVHKDEGWLLSLLLWMSLKLIMLFLLKYCFLGLMTVV